jgi:hypothetical protein
MSRRIWVSIWLLITGFGLAYAQQTGSIGGLRGRTDSNQQLLVAVAQGDTALTVDANIINVPSVNVANLAPSASASYATTPCDKLSTASTNATSCATATANYYGVEIVNTTTTAAYLHLYNNAGSPTCNASIIRTIPIPAASAAGVFGGLALPAIIPTNYTTGIALCITSGIDGTGNAPAGVYVRLNYKQ